MKILNLYAGIGGNRKLWGDEHEVTAVESEQYIADVYKHFFPNDTVVVGDAHQYLIDHFKEFDFIWSSPPCPTHSKMNSALSGWNIYRYPDMALYQEIIFLKHWFKGDWLVENVESYYNPLITPTTTFDRHYFWSNFYIPTMLTGRNYSVTDTKKEVAAAHLGFELPAGTKNQRKLLRNAVDPKMGLHIFNAAQKHRSRTEGNDLVALDLELL
jgi:DNA (cytosine-5)-methyltransferase 1